MPVTVGMRAYLLGLAAVALVGCGTAAAPRPVVAKATAQSPGRVVVYRNGIAYVERFADVDNGTLALAVPGDKVDDLLKSLTAVDVATGEPVPVAYNPGNEADGVVSLQVGGKTAGKRRLRLTYVTGAPAWKPSYRVVVGKTGDVELQGWAIVDNASGEDWKDVRLGVGASSALSFRFDLKSLHNVDRVALEDELQFAQAAAPPVAMNNERRQAQAMGPGQAPPPAKAGAMAAPVAPAPPGPALPPSTDPIGTSHFESPNPMTVPKGTSAMVSILRSSTEGEVVYLYDPQNPKADAKFPYRTIRFRNPSDGALEAGPLSVFGDGRFVGEGLADPVPAKSIAFVPFALDRQVQVEQRMDGRDEITRIAGVSHGVFNTELNHVQKRTYSFTNRMGEKATVYLKYTVQPGFKLSKFPDTRSPAPGATDSSDHLADTSLFKVDLEPNGHVDVQIEETLPQKRVTDIRTPGALEQVRTFLASDAAPKELKPHIDRLLQVSSNIAKGDEKINETQAQLSQEQTRIEELKNQLATLKTVKSGASLSAELDKKLAELVKKAAADTVTLVSLQEKRMVAEVELQNAVADTSLDHDGAAKTLAALDLAKLRPSSAGRAAIHR